MEQRTTTEIMLLTIAVIGGTGKEGAGLAYRWANSGYRVYIGSRDAERAKAKASELNTQLGGDFVDGMSNQDAAANAEVVVLSVPYDAHQAILESIRDKMKGKLLIDVSVPLQPPNVRQVFVPEGKSAALETQALMGSEAKVVAAFQNVSAVHLMDLNHQIQCDVLVCSDHVDAKADTMKLVEAAGMRGIDAGPLVNAVAVEALTPVLLYINKQYKVKGAGIRITGLNAE